MRDTALRIWRDKTGSTAIEYALIASLIAVVIVGALLLIGQSLSGFFTSVSNGF